MTGRARYSLVTIAIAVAALPGNAAGALRAQTAALPARIVSTSPSITETLFALGLGDRVVGVSNYCRYPADVTKLPRVGTFLKPNVETIARLKPDLVFVHTGPNTTASQLTTLGIRSATVDRGALSSVFTTIRQIGSAAGVADRADRLVDELSGKLKRVSASVAGERPRKVLIIVGRRVGTLTDIVAVGHGSYLSDIAAIAGGTNVLNSTNLEYPRISMETIIRLAPDAIIDVGEMGEAPESWDKRRPVTEALWNEQTLVKAVREKHVYVIHDESFVVPGPRVLEVANTMASLFHPSAVK